MRGPCVTRIPEPNLFVTLLAPHSGRYLGGWKRHWHELAWTLVCLLHTVHGLPVRQRLKTVALQSMSSWVQQDGQMHLSSPSSTKIWLTQRKTLVKPSWQDILSRNKVRRNSFLSSHACLVRHWLNVSLIHTVALKSQVHSQSGGIQEMCKNYKQQSETYQVRWSCL